MMMFAYVLTIFISQGLLTVYRLQYGLHMLLRESLEVSAMQACAKMHTWLTSAVVVVVGHAPARDVAGTVLAA